MEVIIVFCGLQLHVNPCFHIADTNKGVAILPKNTPVELKDGDMFALLPNQYWFKARICNETHNGNGLIASEIDNITPDQIDFQPSTSSGQKRKCDDFDSEQNKSARCSINTSPHNIKKEPDLDVTAQLSASVADGDITSQISSLKVEVEPPGESSGNPAWETANTHRLLVESNNVKKETVSDDEDQNQDEIPNEEEEQGTVKQEDTSNQPGEKNDSEKPKKTFRDRCWYGASCYRFVLSCSHCFFVFLMFFFSFRQNPDHKLKLSHPGDQDYDTDPEDNRPSCSYGAVCYRRNSDHRREFRHPKNAVPPSQRKSKPNVMYVFQNCTCCFHNGKPNCNRKDGYESDADSD